MSDTAVGEFDQVDDNTQPGKLRQLLEQALAANKQLTTKVTDLETAATQRAVDSTWNELKVPDVIRGMYTGDKTADAIKAWWDSAKGLFNVEAVEQQAPEVQAQVTPEQQANLQAAQQFQQASGLGDSGFVTGFEATQKQAAETAEAYKTGRMSEADFLAARDKFYEGQGTPKY